MIRRISIIAFSIMTIFIWISVNVSAENDDHVNPILLDLSSYETYINSKDQFYPNEEIVIEGENYTTVNNLGEENIETIINLDCDCTALLTPEQGEVEWRFNVPVKGLYNIKIVYYPIEGKSSPIERTVYINGEVPFDDLKNVTFYRLWKDEFNVTDNRDKSMNDIKPSQIEEPQWITQMIKGNDRIEPFYVEFNQGENSIKLNALKEPLLIDKIILYQEEEIPSYNERLTTYVENGYTIVNDKKTKVKVQGEDAAYKSSPTLYPLSDRSSFLTEPYETKKIRLNAIGGTNWRVSGDFITWNIEVPKTGLYNITIKALQNFNRGSFSTRMLLIDGKVPFKEAGQLEFNYSGDWQNYTLGQGKSDYQFYLTEGQHEITLQTTVGRYDSLISQVESNVTKLNDLYREIIMFTSVSPDPYRDYQLDKRIPDIRERFSEIADSLDEVIDGVIKIAGQRSDKIAALDKTSLQLKSFSESPREIKTRLKEFKQNISGLGTWVLTAKEQPLSIDYMIVHAINYEVPRAKANFFEKIWHEITLFFTSFFTDYSLQSNSKVKTTSEIDVWIGSGRDQANVLRQLIDESFTPQTGIKVNLKLVNSNVLLPATLAGNGPDVAMHVTEDIPVNYGMRNAIYDISQFDDFKEVKERFYDSALVPYEYQDGYYGLPEQQMFLVLFYRTDILSELGLETPQTWQDVINMIPVLQRYNLDFYLPQTPTQLNPLLASLIKQNQGTLYTEDGKELNLINKVGTDAFVQFSNFYTDYKFTLNANFPNRFRTGEMPIGVSYYTDYNVLSVFAPEINGLWEFKELPGTMQPDGTIDNSSASQTTGVVLLENSKNKESAWEYMKWWTSTETQVRYAREMEGILGAAARYPTANKEALAQLPWPSRDYAILESQIQKTVGIPVVPGSYITGRYLDNAFRDVINNGANPREALYDYVRKINVEIKRKREEFGLD